MKAIQEKRVKDIRRHTRYVAFTALFTALGIVTNLLSGQVGAVPFFGRVSFVYTSSMLSGIFLGPGYGTLAAFLADLLPAFMMPQEGMAYNPLIGLGAALSALLPALVFVAFKKKSLAFKLVLSAFLSYAVVTCGINAVAMIPFYHTFSQTGTYKVMAALLKTDSRFVAIAVTKAITQPLWIVVNLILTALIIRALPVKRYSLFFAG